MSKQASRFVIDILYTCSMSSLPVVFGALLLTTSHAKSATPHAASLPRCHRTSRLMPPWSPASPILVLWSCCLESSLRGLDSGDWRMQSGLSQVHFDSSEVTQGQCMHEKGSLDPSDASNVAVRLCCPARSSSWQKACTRSNKGVIHFRNKTDLDPGSPVCRSRRGGQNPD